LSLVESGRELQRDEGIQVKTTKEKDGKVQDCNLNIPPGGECRDNKLIVSTLGEGLQPFCKKHRKWCYHADVKLGEANDE